MRHLSSISVLVACLVLAACDRDAPERRAPEAGTDLAALPQPEADGGPVTGFDGEAPPARPPATTTTADAGTGDPDAPVASIGDGQLPFDPTAPAGDANAGQRARTVPPAAPDGAGTAPTTPEPAASEAAALLRGYYGAINAGQHARAYGMWSDGGRASGQTADQFARGFSDTARVTVRTGEPGRVEGAAGSRFVTIPVAVEAVQADGSIHHYDGTYTLRRAVVDGATDEQRQWRISDADLREVE